MLMAWPVLGASEILVRDIGTIGLFSHDIFAWDRKSKTNLENGRLDLSTIFDYKSGHYWITGGNPKNSDNPPVYTVAMQLVDYYRGRMLRGYGADEARRLTVLRFHEMVRATYERLRGKPLPPRYLRAAVSNQEQAAFRGLHDAIPGHIPLVGRWIDESVSMTSYWLRQTLLNEVELDQPIANFDGDYDESFKNITIPFTGVSFNLMEVDRKFIEANSPYKQADMLAALAAYGHGEISSEEVFFMPDLDSLFAKAFCPEGNPWMPAGECE
ncbi:MAG: hypothetical protein KF799_11175 [Bdellovibrionales bacterium]|nr:hypothetical protein [Bdellovibrionales bacterium]